MFVINVLSLLSVSSMVRIVVYGLQCMSETGDPVDWYIVYKIPKLESSAIKTVKNGYGYTYITDQSIKSSDDWILSDKSMDDKSSIFGQTIGPVIDAVATSSPAISYVVYNDQPPDSSTSSGAHSKGLFAIDSNTGFWLSHSLPRFPAVDQSYDFPDNARHNGQTAICMSVSADDSETVNNIVHQLLMIRPKIYGINILDDLIDKSKLWDDLVHKKWIKTDTQSQLSVKTINGLDLTSFAKSSKYDKDIYSALIATAFKEDFLVQSWRNGAGEKLPSDCKDKYKVQNVDRIQIPDIGVKDVDWEYTEDHSKWGITTDDKGTAYTCIADINRMKSQFKRGGGSLCFADEKVWHIFKKSVEGIEGCHAKSGSTHKKDSHHKKSSHLKSGSHHKRANILPTILPNILLFIFYNFY